MGPKIGNEITTLKVWYDSLFEKKRRKILFNYSRQCSKSEFLDKIKCISVYITNYLNWECFFQYNE